MTGKDVGLRPPCRRCGIDVQSPAAGTGDHMKKRITLWILVLTLRLTACGQRGEMPPEEAPPALEVQAPEQSGESVRLSRQIMSEEELEYTNREDCSNGFVLAEREEDGALFLEFTRPDAPDFSLRISQDLTEALAEYQGRTMTLERVETPNGTLYDWYVSAGYGGLVSGYSMPSWVDFTGDGQPELAWLRHGSGTGFHESVCTVYNISGQGEIIPLVEPWEEMAASITVEPQDWEDGYIRSLVTDCQGQTYTAWQWVQEEAWRDCSYWPGKSGWASLEIDQERCTLEAVMLFGLEVPHMFGAYMGGLRTELAYDAEQGAIIRSGPIAVSVDEKLER